MRATANPRRCLSAKGLIDYLHEAGYYEKDAHAVRKDGKLVIEGAVCLFDLHAGTVDAHYGMADDAWVRITLPAYLT